VKFYSERNKRLIVPAKQAVLQGIADDGGLYMPVTIPHFSDAFFNILRSMTFQELSFKIAKFYFGEELSDTKLESIITGAFNFDVNLTRLSEKINILELFHGPTLAFKDFGARFMARLISTYIQDNDKDITILVATSGDTGSAVASGFHNQPGIQIILLYPSGMVSEIQEKQLTTYSGNVKALEISGTFDDCQRLVKMAFGDKDIKSRKRLSSANSINIARFIPQSFYYYYAYGKLENKNQPLVFSVPSGNLGNLAAGLLAKASGLPAYKFIAALNSNKIFLEYLQSGRYTPVPAIPTISNAMDVGNPSNAARITALYQRNMDKMINDIVGASFSDPETRSAIRQVYSDFGNIIDPHTAVGFLALKKYIKEKRIDDYSGIILGTAHPAKFSNIVNEELRFEIEIPQKLKKCLSLEKKSIKMSNKFAEFKDFLMQN
jgi:threonine synthase